LLIPFLHNLNYLSLSALSTKLALIGIDISKPSLHKLETGQRVLKDYGADNLNGATPIIKIANSFGFSCIQAQNIPEDISGNIIHVKRTEICYEDDNGKRVFPVRDFPKTEAGIRDVIIPEKYVRYLNKALQVSSGEYLFEINGKRILTYQFRNRLKTVCKKTHVVNKSPHKIRKTYASMLIDSGVNEAVIISQMGHTDIKTTKGFYYRNRANEEKKKNIINGLGL